MSAQENKNIKCYNRFSCILSVFVIVFVLGSIVYDMLISKPAMRSSIDEIKTEVQVINSKLDGSYTADSTKVIEILPDSAK